MKLVDLRCPGCGAQLNVDLDQKQAMCPYCNKMFPVDDEVQYVKLDGAAQAGYEFEKGRQQAQAEFAAHQQPQQVYINAQQPEPPKKRRTWLWALGWILIFPVPLTILMLKNEKMDKKVRYIIIAIGWILYAALVFGYGGANRDKKDPNAGSSSAAVTAAQPSSAASASASSEVSNAATSGPTKDGVVNAFIAAYNSISASPIGEVKQGNTATKWFGSSYGYQLTMLHANNTDKIDVTINETNENADAGVPGMRDVFHDVAKAIDPSLSDESIYGYFDRACDDPSSTGDQMLGTVEVFWSNDVDLSTGHMRGYLELSAK